MKRLHLRCGNDIQAGLTQAGIAGDFVSWGDPVCEGPCPDLSSKEFRERRCEFIKENWEAGLDSSESISSVHERFERDDATIERLADYEEIVLWFEHDLYDQSILIQLLSRLRDRRELHSRIKIVSTGSYPGVERFIGLGQLSPEQLLDLYGQRKSLQTSAYELGSSAWAAYKNIDPSALLNLAKQEHEELPYLASALIRHFQEFPWEADGLSLTERLSLQAIAQGAKTAGQVFRTCVMSLDPQPYLGDVMFFANLRRLLSSDAPVIEWDGEARGPIALTDLGQRLVAGQTNWLVGQPSYDRWRGGVKLTRDSLWLWDDTHQTLVRP